MASLGDAGAFPDAEQMTEVSSDQKAAPSDGFSDDGGNVLVSPLGDNDKERADTPTPSLRSSGRNNRGACCGCFERPQWAQKVWLLFDDPQSSKYALWLGWAILLLIFVSTLSFVLETVDAIKDTAGEVLEVVETFCIVVFTLELVIRFATCPNQCNFLTKMFNWIDVIAVAPFYIELAMPSAGGAGRFGVIRVMRLVRVARVVKVSRYSKSIRIFTQAMTSSVRPLTMLIFLVTIAMIVFSSGIYYAELTEDGCREGEWEVAGTKEVCEEGSNGWERVEGSNAGLFTKNGIQVQCWCASENPFVSIPSTFWWCLVTMTTVGYGDNVPVTATGRFVAVVTMLSGIIILALPITVIGTNFARVLRKMQRDKMLSDLENLDHNDDGVIDMSELESLLKLLAALAPTEDMANSIPASAKKLLSKYDADNSGVLEAVEMSLLKKDLAGIIGPSHPAYHQLLDEANRELQMAGVATGRRDSVASQVSEISREARQRRKSRKMAASSARTTASANSRPSAGFVPSFRGGRHRVPHSRLVREYQRQSRRMSMEGDASHHGEGSPTFVVHDPVGQDYIHQRLEEIQEGVDTKLAAIADVLNIINLSLHQSADPML